MTIMVKFVVNWDTLRNTFCSQVALSCNVKANVHKVATVLQSVTSYWESMNLHMFYMLQAEEAKSFDFWAFKRALLGTLLKAVKAIKGGIIAIKGQIIKAKGHFLSSKGRFVSAKGEAISNFGKQLASTALNLDKPKTVVHTAPSAGYSSGPTASSGKV